MSDDEKKWLTDAVADATIYERKVWHESEVQALKAVEEAGVHITHPDKELFKEKSAGMIEDLKRENPRLYKLVEEIEKVK